LKFKQSFFISLWFVFLTFPLMVIRVNTIEKVVVWRWRNMIYVALGSFIISLVWQYFLARRAARPLTSAAGEAAGGKFFPRVMADPQISRLWRPLLGVFLLASPFFLSVYHTNVMTTALKQWS
jgi:branched-chain amino acid transport system permease protein